MIRRSLYRVAKIWKLYDKNYLKSIEMLKRIRVFCGSEPKISGLAGWVFEQTIQYCLLRELRALKIRVLASEQVKIGSRGRADLQIGKVLVEIKHSGFFSSDAAKKYFHYRKDAEAAGFVYLFLSGQETHAPYRRMAAKAFGKANTFYLDSNWDWARFVRRSAAILQVDSAR